MIDIEDVAVVAGETAKAVDMGKTTRDAFLQKFDMQVSVAAETM